MDVVLNACDKHFFTPFVYPEWWKEDNIWRQFISLNLIVDTGGALLYLSMATFSYFVIFDKRYLNHPHVLKNQVRREITYALSSIPWMGIPTCLCFLLEVRGHSKLYDKVDDSKYGWGLVVCSTIAFMLFTDCLIYWIHRGLHHRLVYKHLHKPHHWWKVPTPFASHAFHPIDGFLQSSPYHIYVFLFPMHKYLYMILYVVVNIWTVSIHDGHFRVPNTLKPIINGAAHHLDHHLFYNYNYGQYTTFWDRLGGSYREPSGFKIDYTSERVQKAAVSKNNGKDD